jgi:hypothetical protein
MRTEDDLRLALRREVDGPVDVAAGRRAVTRKVRRARLGLALSGATVAAVGALAIGALVAHRGTQTAIPLRATTGHSPQWDACALPMVTPVAEGDDGPVHWVLLLDDFGRTRQPNAVPFLVAAGPRDSNGCGTGLFGTTREVDVNPHLRLAWTGSDSGAIAIGAVDKATTSVEVQFLTGERQTAPVINTGPGVNVNAFIVFHRDEAVSPMGPSLATITVLTGRRMLARWQGGEPLSCDAGEVGRYFVPAPEPLGQGSSDEAAARDAEARTYAHVRHTGTKRLPNGDVAVLRGDRIVGVFEVTEGKVERDRHCVKR